ncbi:S41 family peptidase [Streptomyces sp. NRRL WC-3742]|uniref:S41 family peptidase n=1 Tax=Streptomyces sp. NRRL WC-3742 TaxID=1463934 RepID=UPI000D1431BC|nr:S41 family peptidase [Streptomyces sp. NRRL WC-3742]
MGGGGGVPRGGRPAPGGAGRHGDRTRQDGGSRRARPRPGSGHGGGGRYGGGGRQPAGGRLADGGYGTIVAIHGTSLTTYDVTRNSCTPGVTTAEQFGTPLPGGAVRYGAPGEPFAQLTVTPHGRHRAVYARDPSTGTRALVRLPGGLPGRCTLPVSNEPLAVFDRFWDSFEENYPFFDAKGVDWHAQRAAYRPKVTAENLVDTIIAMVAPLQDSHIALLRATPDGGYRTFFRAMRAGTVAPTPELLAAVRPPVNAQLTAPEQQFANGLIGVGRLPDDLGYLRVSAFSDYAAGGQQAQEAELDRAADALLTPALRGVVIDVRVNAGGSDALAVRLASRFTDHPYLAYRKIARNDPADPTAFTPPQPVTVRPAAGAARFTGPVALLTSGSTVSAGETFTQAMTGRTPHVTRIGENTQGVFSDGLPRRLSPDLLLLLPNEEFLTPAGTTFDGPGIPPDTRTPVFTPEELAALKDSALTEARRLLTAEAGRR